MGHMLWLIARLTLALYLLASALAAFDRARLGLPQIAIRLVLAVLVLSGPVWVHGPAILAVGVLLGLHFAAHRQA